MLILSIANFLLALFLGYLMGRVGDYYLNFWLEDPSWAPHHWIYGLILVILGAFIFKNNLGLWMISFGIGLFVSDLKDFSNFRFFGKDNKNRDQRKFWHID